jgi:hypothetical protein
MKRIIIIAALVCGSAHAEFMDGNKLLADMQNPQETWRMFAMGYIAGVADAGRGTYNCPPANVLLGQANDAVRQHLEANPTMRHYSADIIINYVLGKAWPCAKKGSAL